MQRTVVWVGLISCIMISTSNAWAGKETGNGGDPIGIEFHKAAEQVIADVEQTRSFYPELGSIDLNAVLQSATILATDDRLTVPVGNQTQDSTAENDPIQKIIWVNRTAWNQNKSPQVRKALAFHELLGLVGLETTGQYPISGRYLTEGLGLSVLDQVFDCTSYAQMMNKFDQVIAVDVQKARMSWWSQTIPGGAISVQHHLNDLGYVVWLNMQDMGKPGGQDGKEFFQFSYVISDTADLLRTTFSKTQLTTVDSPLPRSFMLLPDGRMPKFPDGDHMAFSVSCEQIN